MAGGVVFGVLMQMRGMLAMVATLVGSESVAVGGMVHLVISAFIGSTYALIFGRWADRLVAGAVLGEFADRGLLRRGRGRGRIILLDVDGLGAEAGD